MPQVKPEMTEFWTAMAARARVPTWPAKMTVTARREYRQREMKMAGPARYQSFFDSRRNSWKKLPPPPPSRGGMSPEEISSGCSSLSMLIWMDGSMFLTADLCVCRQENKVYSYKHNVTNIH